MNHSHQELDTPASELMPGEKLTDHNYDGIQEYDNPMPTWWTLTFYATVAWSAVYFIGIGMGLLPSYGDDLKTEQDDLASIRKKYEDSQPKIVITEEALVEASKDPGRVQAGATVYAEKCAPCHGDKGQGVIGPNLTDNQWIHGGSLTSIHGVVEKGFTAKGMPAWKGVLKDPQLVDVVGYIHTLQGTNPPNPKAPEGEVYPPKG